MSDPTPPDFRALLKRSLEKVAELRAALSARDAGASEPLAVVGIGCRFPGGADSPEGFWRVITGGHDVVRELPEGRWPFDPALQAAAATRWAGFLDGVDKFDAGFFGISPREAAVLDPQQRLLLEVAWEALEDAGQPQPVLSGSRTGVFVGLTTLDYQQRVLGGEPADLDVYALTGNSQCFAAGRLSYMLGLQGPCLAVDTACSSSLTAVHLACDSLRDRQCDLALAGGVNLILSPVATHMLAQAQALSPGGRCRTFDAAADGFVRGEGCGVVVLKRLADARRDGDRIWALVRGSAINQDGRSTGLTAPNVLSQQSLLRDALARAGLAPEQVGYIETHGTGTPLGDPIEIDALKAVYGRPRQDGSTIRLGALKTCTGHLEAAAGIAGLIKAVLAMHHCQIPGNLHFTALNPRMSLADTPLVVAAEATPWQPGPAPRIAGISAFGFSGSNAHVLIEEPPITDAPASANDPRPIASTSSAARPLVEASLAAPVSPDTHEPRQARPSPASPQSQHPGPADASLPSPSSARAPALAAPSPPQSQHPGPADAPLLSPLSARAPALAPPASPQSQHPGPADAPLLLPLSTRAPAALRQLAERMRARLDRLPDRRALDDLLHTAATRRTHHSHRLAVAGADLDDLRAGLDAWLAGREHRAVASGQLRPGGRPRLAFVFPGMGTRCAGVGRQLLADEPVFARAFADAADAVRRHGDIDVRAALDDDASLARVEVFQPTLFAVEVALAALWHAWGVRPDAVVGHSLGEIAAAHVAGALHLDDAARIVCARSRLLTDPRARGAMAVVDLPPEGLLPHLEQFAGRLVLAAHNAPAATVVSGPAADLEVLLRQLADHGVDARRLSVDIAFHSPHMDPLCAPLAQALRGLEPLRGATPLYSTVRGGLLDPARLTPAHWVNNLRAPVRFAEAIDHLLADGFTLFLEIGPRPSLLGFLDLALRQAGPAGERHALASLRSGLGERTALRAALGALHTRGYPVDWQQHAPAGRCVALPTYPWQRERHWIDPRPRRPAAPTSSGLGEPLDLADPPGGYLWHGELDPRRTPYLRDHRVHDVPVASGAVLLDLVAAAAAAALNLGPDFSNALHLRDLHHAAPLVLADDAARALQTTLTPEGDRHWRIVVSSRPQATREPWTRHLSATIESPYPGESPVESTPRASPSHESQHIESPHLVSPSGGASRSPGVASSLPVEPNRKSTHFLDSPLVGPSRESTHLESSSCVGPSGGLKHLSDSPRESSPSVDPGRESTHRDAAATVPPPLDLASPPSDDSLTTPLSLAALRDACRQPVDLAELYARLDAGGSGFGPAFRGVDRLWRGDGSLLASVQAPPGLPPDAVAAMHPAVLDACVHVLAAAALLPDAAPVALVGGGIDRVILRARPRGTCLWSHVVLRPADPGVLLGDITILDEHESPIARLEGVRLHAAAPAARDHDLRRRLLDAAPDRRPHLLEQHLLGLLAHVLRIDPERIAVDGGFADLGLDSLMVVELRDALRVGLGLQIAAALLWQHPSARALAACLLTRLDSPERSAS
ncbi:type I polyketide synthase [Nannocystis bainbridge]|uniref:Beta-ketoacyl synthase N-terminal-like domain-containing protein n=1 Tax=Nannocystis bainbridge TaxID=2995303 RepID=A0ABT5E5N4_9BACT|nr:type I polyketide synthase [Nannocystis bainbridge]MDC0721165.1 beta-ketoacyl synthase N-terminal-like domain-containing protein [Nannocystis bainbridge]